MAVGSSGLQPRRRVTQHALQHPGGGGGSSSSTTGANGGVASSSASSLPDLHLLVRALRKDLKGNAKAFWEALKLLASQKYGNAEAAFRAHSDAKDGLMVFRQFQELCESVGLHNVPVSSLRTLFDAHQDPDEGAWSVNIFMDTLLVKRIDRIRGKLHEYNKGLARMHAHADNFIRKLCLQSGEEGRRRAVARFQRKLTIPFCFELYVALKRMQLRWADIDRERDVDCALLLRTVGTLCQNVCFQAYEMDFLANIFDRIDRARTGRVSTVDLAVSIALLAAEASPFDKARLLFFVFDDDEDGCLSREQILRMYCCATIHGAIARGDQSSYDADIVLGDELSLSKARRLFDYTAVQMGFGAGGMDELCTFQELWAIFEAHPMLIEELMPGTNSIMWVLRPVAGAQAERSPRLPPRQHSVKEQLGRRRTTVATVATTVQRTPQLAANFSPSSTRLPLELGVNEGHVKQALPRQPNGSNFTEWFRKAAAVRFRHAVRGEWDAVDALQNAMKQDLVEDSPSDACHLPSLAVGGATVTSTRAEPQAPFSSTFAEDALTSYERRQAQGKNWNDVHRTTLTGWARGLDAGRFDDNGRATAKSKLRVSASGRFTGSMRQSQSLPALDPGRSISGASHRTALSANALKQSSTPPPRQPKEGRGNPRSTSRGSSRRNGIQSSATVKELRAGMKAKVAETAAEAAPSMEAVPIAEAGNQRYGTNAMRRFRCFSEVKACSAKASTLGEPDSGPSSPVFEYDCQLCRGRHGASLPCVG